MRLLPDKNCEWSEIFFTLLQVKNLACHRFINEDRKHDILDRR